MTGLRGLPGPLPPGERVLWQGSPASSTLLRRVFRVRGLAAYFAVILAWSAGSALAHGTPSGTALLGTARLACVAAVPFVLLGLYAALVARGTVYTITSRRVVMRFGLALPMSVNLPLALVEAADLRLHADGTGDLGLRLAATRLSYAVLWPHARPWRLARPEPALRAIPDAARAARILEAALHATVPAPAAPALAPPARRAAHADAVA